MALAQLPPDQTELDKKEYAAWLDSAIGQLRSAEMEETYDNLAAILTSKAYVELSTADSNGGYPSPTAFMALAPDLRKKRLSTLVRSANDLEFGMITFLDNLAESEPDRALALIGDLSRGGASGDFRAQLAHAADVAHRVQAEAAHINLHHDFASLKDLPELLPHESPPLAHAYPGSEDALPPRPKRRPKKVAHMGQNPGDDIFITGEKN